MKLNATQIAALEEIVGAAAVFLDKETTLEYGHDHTEDLSFPPFLVLKPQNTEQISAIMKWATANSIPVTPIGARTGLSGGSLSIIGGVGLSLEKLNAIINIDENNFQVTVEPGVITQNLMDAVAEKGLCYPVDPSSKGSCFIGGNIAENSGGARAVKYGVTKDYVLNLEVVLPNGEIIWTGANTLKNATGYNLTQLIVGSEGTLGIVTKIVLKLIKPSPLNVLLLIPFYNAVEACEAVAAILKTGIVPSALEFMEKDALVWGSKYVDGAVVAIKSGIEAHLLVELDGDFMENLMQQAEKVMEVAENYKIGEVLFADTEEQKNTLWRVRRCVGEAVKANSIYKEEDTVVPRFALPVLLKGIKDIGSKYGFQSVCYGHAGDGNLHVNIIKGNLTDEQWNTEVTKGIREIFHLTVSLKGTLSGEHGIGLVQKNYMDIAFPKFQLQLMRDIKKVFDPLNIMNPGKVLPDSI